MHWWQIAIRLLLIANCWGNFRDAIRAGREHHQERLHWLIPKAIAWAMFFFAVLPARYGGVGLKHLEIVVWISIALFFYGMIIEMTDLSAPNIFNFSAELPHLGRIDASLMPLVSILLPILAFLLFVSDAVSGHHFAPKHEELLVMLSLGLLFGVRLLMRQYSLSKLSDLVELTRFRPRPVETPAQHDWIKPDKDGEPS